MRSLSHALALAVLLMIGGESRAQEAEGLLGGGGPGHPWQGGPSRASPHATVNLHTLALQTEIVLLGFHGHDRTQVEFALRHNSQAAPAADDSGAALGPKWAHSYSTFVRTWIEGAVSRAAVHQGDHRVAMFTLVGSTWRNDDGYRDRLARSGSSFVLTDGEGLRSFFDITVDVLHARLGAIEDRSGNRVVLNYDRAGSLASVNDGCGREIQFLYAATAFGPRLTDVVFAGSGFSRRWKLSYDGSGCLRRVTWPAVKQGGSVVSHTVQLDYTADGRNNVAIVTDRAGNAWSCRYLKDFVVFNLAPGRVNPRTTYTAVSSLIRAVTDPEGATTMYYFDTDGRLVRVDDAAGLATLFEYLDPHYAWSPSGITRPSGAKLRRSFDLGGRVVAVIDETGNQFDFVYDARGLLVQALEPICTDAWGVKDLQRRRTDFAWDAARRLIARTSWLDPLTPATTSWAYDSNGDLVAMTNANGETTKYDYDARGNRVRTVTPSGRAHERLYENARTTFNYTLHDAEVDGIGRRGELQRDALGRLVREVFPDGSGRSFAYDSLDRVVRVTKGADTSIVAWTPQSWLESVLTAAGMVRYDYLANGQRDRVVLDPGLPTRRVVRYQYDAARRISLLDDAGRITSFFHDVDGRLNQVQYHNGASKWYFFDPSGRPILIEHRDPKGAVFSSYSPAWQENGLLKCVLEQDAYGPVTTRYGYDFADRLVREEKSGGVVADSQWVLDASGRRAGAIVNGVPVNYVLDADGLVLSTTAGDLFTWDQNGRLAERLRQSVHHRFTCDFSGRLVDVDLDTRSRLGWRPLFRYAYDGFDRRVRREVWNGLGTMIAEHEYLHSLDQVFRERACAPSGTPLLETETIFGGGELISRRDALNGAGTSPATDPFGSMRAACDAGGSVQFSGVLHDRFGRAVVGGAAPWPTSFAADDGWREEGDAGLLFDGDAYHDPVVGIQLPSSIESTACANLDEWTKLQLMKRLLDRGCELLHAAEETERKSEATFLEAAASGTRKELEEATFKWMEIAGAVHVFRTDVESLRDGIRRLESRLTRRLGGYSYCPEW